MATMTRSTTHADFYTLIRASIPMQDILTRYNIPMRNKTAACPFHADDTPSLHIYSDSFYCFGCGAGGDVVKFTAQLLQVSNYEAAKILISDFHLNIQTDGKADFRAAMKREKQQRSEQDFNRWATQSIRTLIDYRRKLWLARKQPDPNNPLFQESLQNLETIDYYIESFEQDPRNFYKTNRQVVIDIESRNYRNL